MRNSTHLKFPRESTSSFEDLLIESPSNILTKPQPPRCTQGRLLIAISHLLLKHEWLLMNHQTFQESANMKGRNLRDRATPTERLASQVERLLQLMPPRLACITGSPGSQPFPITSPHCRLGFTSFLPLCHRASLVPRMAQKRLQHGRPGFGPGSEDSWSMKFSSILAWKTLRAEVKATVHGPTFVNPFQ